MKKSIFLFFAAILCAMSVQGAVVTPQGKYFYFKPSSDWKKDGARFAVCFQWKDGGAQDDAWVSCTAVPGATDIYYVKAPDKYWDIFFCRMNGSNQTNDWSNKWNQTDKLQYDGSKNYWTKSSTDWNGAATYSTYAPPMSSVTLADNGTTVNSGTGTQADPYIIEIGTTIKVQASGTKAVDDPDAVINYTFKYGATSQDSETTTWEIDANSPSTTYAIELEGYTKVNTTSSEKKAATKLYYQTVADATLPTYQVTVTANDPAMGTVTGTGEYSEGATAELTATPNDGYKFVNWTVGSTEKSTNATYSFTVTENVTLTANFQEIPKVTVYAINSVKWDAIAVHHWHEGGAGTEWPGDLMINTGEKAPNGFDVYTATFLAEHENCIFNNNGNGSQTGTLDVKNGQYYDLKSNKWYASLAEVPTPDPLATDVFLVGSMNAWSTTANEFKKVEEGSATATLTMNLEAETVYEFKVVREGAWTSSQDSRDIKGSVSELVFSSSVGDNTMMTTTVAGDYVFTWNDSKLSITYPASAEPEPTELTYNVTVPAGTKACYICGNMTGWNFTEMTKVDDTHYTITIEGAKQNDGYKYASGSDWGYVEKDANGNEIGDRTYVDGNDVVARWASVYDPDAVEQELTYSVTVPEGTYACYIAMDTDPAQDGWEFNEMTKVDDTHYTFTRTGLKSKTYKYASGAGWEYVEKTDEDGEVADRTWAENDVVAKWASVYNPSAPTYDYYVIGTVNNWGLKDENFGMTDEDADGVYEKEVTLTANNKHELKINNGSWDDNTQIFGFDQLNVAYEGVSRGSGDGDNNVVIELTEDKTITVKFDKNAGKITLDGLTEVETETLVYTVEVPEGTEDCYIAGQMNNWEFERMTQVNATQWTITYDNVLKTTEYKYACQASWDYKELDKEGNDIANRTWTALDKVEKWAEPAEVKCYLMGNGDWVNGVEMEEDGAQFKLLAHHIYAPFKFKFGETWTADVENTTFEGLGSEDDGNGGTNITLPEGLYDFYFKKDTKKVYIALAGYVRNVTNTYGTICLPYASASTAGATFFEVVGQEAGKVYLASVTELEAGVPYIFEKSANQIKVVYTGDKKDAPVNTDANGLIGNFTNDKVVPAGNYILYNNEFRKSDGEAKVNAYRAYLDLSAVEGGKPTHTMPGRRYIGMSVQGENVETGVEDIITTDAPVKVIENGQLIIIREGVKYNVQGQKL